MTDEQLDAIAKLIDRIDDFRSMADAPVSDRLLAETLTDGFNEIRQTLQELYIDAGGLDRWGKNE